ncbi:MAG: extradiol dioxygenase [Thermoplasmata archaeon]|nr:extradiol dioxygenase [Thermoplasmata archaeon]
MMLKFITLMPHGEEVLNPKDDETKSLKMLMQEIGESANDIAEFIVLSPHSIRIMDHISIIFSEHVSNGKDFPVDRKLAHIIFTESKRNNLPVVEVNYGALEGKESKIPLDWGTSIPLEFFKNVKNLVIISPARIIDINHLIKFGEILAQVTDNYENDIGIIVSADNAHSHKEDGPYGFSKYAKIYDDFIINSFKNNKIEAIAKLDEKIVEEAKPDSFWQILVLVGILKRKNFLVQEIKYSCPSYFGMMAAKFTKV